MELRHLNAFLHVATLMSFCKAAESLNYAQSTISARIQGLEEELGVRLFDRLGKRIRLTEAGQKLLPHARRLLNQAKEAVADVSSCSGPYGSLNIMIPESLLTHCLPLLLPRFQDEFPGISLNFSTCVFHGLEQDLRRGIADLAFLLADSASGANTVVEFLGVTPLVLVAAPDHPLSAKAQVRAGDLAGQPLLLSTSDCSYRRSFEELLLERKIYPGAVMEFNSVAALKKAVAAGLGLSILPRMSVEEEAERSVLSVLNWTEEEMETAILMIRHKDKWLSPTLRAFMKMAGEGLAAGSGRR